MLADRLASLYACTLDETCYDFIAVDAPDCAMFDCAALARTEEALRAIGFDRLGDFSQPWVAQATARPSPLRVLADRSGRYVAGIYFPRLPGTRIFGAWPRRALAWLRGGVPRLEFETELDDGRVIRTLTELSVGRRERPDADTRIVSSRLAVAEMFADHRTSVAVNLSERPDIRPVEIRTVDALLAKERREAARAIARQVAAGGFARDELQEAIESIGIFRRIVRVDIDLLDHMIRQRIAEEMARRRGPPAEA